MPRNRIIAAKQPIAPRIKRGKTAKPLAPARIAAILDALRQTYPGVVCALNHRNAWELTVATILSAQCTDARVNLVTPKLFRLFPTPRSLAAASPAEIEPIIQSTGFFRNKAKNLAGAARVLVERFHAKVPETMEDMLEIPGVARKTANVVLGSWYGIPSGVVVDTHVLRLSRRLELTREDDPVTSSSTTAAKFASPANPAAPTALWNTSATPPTKPGHPTSGGYPPTVSP